MKKLLMAALLLGVVCVAKSEAGVAKNYYSEKYATTISTVVIGDAALYSVMLGTGAAGEFINFFDTANVTGLATTYITSSPFVFRLLYSTVTPSGATVGNTLYKFDPPIQFNNGIMIAPSAATGTALITYEVGRP
jgi:hypothetical protein